MKKAQTGIKPLRKRNGGSAKELLQHNWVYMECEDGCGQSVRVPNDTVAVKCSVCSMKKTEFPIHPDYADNSNTKSGKPGRPRKKRGVAEKNTKVKPIKSKTGKKRGRPRKVK